MPEVCPAPSDLRYALSGSRTGPRLSREFGRAALPTHPRPEQFRNEMRKVAGAKQMARNAGHPSGVAVQFLVADKKTRGAIDRPALEKIQYHPGSGLPPVADAAVLRHRCSGVKRTVADVVEMRSDLRQLDRQLRMQRQKSSSVYRPFAIPDWLVTTKTKKPASFSNFIAALAPSIQRKRLREPTYPSS